MNLKKTILNILFYGSVIFYGIILFEGMYWGWEYGDICLVFVGMKCAEVSQASFPHMAPFIIVHVFPALLIVIFYIMKKRFQN